MFRKLLFIVLGVVLLGGFTVAEADGKKGKLVLLVDTHGFLTFDTGAPGDPADPTFALGGFPFYVSGDICKEKSLFVPHTNTPSPCTPIGVFHCWGWDTGRMPPGPVLVNQEYEIWGKGKIQVQGVEDEGPRAVTGGTGKFSNVRGQATGFDFSEFSTTGRFVATFKLAGVKSRRSHDDDSDSDSD